MSNQLDGKTQKCPFCDLIIAVAGELDNLDLGAQLAAAMSEHLHKDHPEYLSPQTSTPAEP